MGYKLNGVETGGIPMHLVKPLIENYKIDILIECGTAGGESIKEASRYFKHCETIEVVKNRQEIDRSIKNIKWHTGFSVEILHKIIDELIAEKEKIHKPDGVTPVYMYALFWIDSHYSDPEPNTSGYKECYILEELEVISKYNDSAIILIDDARLFLGQPPYPNDPKDWPGIQQIFALLNEKYPHNYHTIVDDYILSLPERLREPIDAEWRARYHIRYPSAEDKLKSQAKDVWFSLMEYLK